jgi:imidazolonepropionase
VYRSRKLRSESSPLLLINIPQLVTLKSDAPAPRRGAALKNLGLVEDAAILCIGGKIISVGRTQDALSDPWVKKNRRQITEIDCGGKVVLPGFVDSHTHPAFMFPRLLDFEKRTAGATYEEIAQAGGGIRSSVESVRQASKGALAASVLAALREMADQGTTTVEAKSGYGLSVESEIKSLAAIREAASRWPGTVVPTLLGAHVVPKEFHSQRQAYIDLICREMIPSAAKQKLAKFVDVFCDRGAFSAAETSKIFQCAKASGLGVRAHICQLSQTKLAPFLGFDPASFDHMDYISEEDIPQLAAGNSVATLVPAANLFLGTEKYSPARKLIDAGVPVALATDYNPGSSPTYSMPFVMSLACTQMKMSPAEAIAAATINGASALRLDTSKGSVEAGKDADLSVFDVSDYREIPYWMATNRCAMTVLNGTVVKFGSAR